MNQKEGLEFVKLRSVELKHNFISDFCINSFGDYIVVQNPIMEAIVFNEINEPDTAELFPYAMVKIDVPQCKSATKLLKEVDMFHIYANSSVQEQQELGLDPLYVAERSVDPTKARLVEVQIAPAILKNKQNTSHINSILAIITTYGTCHILAKDPNGRNWKHQISDITRLLITIVFPIEVSPSDLKTFPDLRNFVNLYNCTACSWHACGNIFYVANAKGYIIVFRIKEELLKYETPQDDMLEYCCKTSMNIDRICHLKSFDDYLIAVSTEGLLCLLKLSHGETNSPKIENIINLWNNKDHRSCRQIVVQKFENGYGYAIICAKGGHLLFFLITESGELKDTKSLLIPGIKITGLELFNTNELVATTVIGKITYVHFEIKHDKSNSASLHMEAKPINAPQIDWTNYEIMGIGASKNKALWFLLIYPNKDLHVSSKQNFLSSYIFLCKPNILNPAQKLIDLKIDTIDPYRDLVLALRMDIWHSNDVNKYNQYFPLLESLASSQKIDDTFLQHLQVNLEIYRATIRRSNYKLQIVNDFVQGEIKFPELSIQITHILLRLEYLQRLIISKGTEGFQALTPFQQKATFTMRKVFNILMEELQQIGDASKKGVNIKAKETVQRFVELFQREMYVKWQNYELEAKLAFEEKCEDCQEPLSDKSLSCQLNHNVRRCNVSFIQQTWFNERFCSQCGTVANNFVDSRDILTELFPTNESVKCTFCRSAFISSEQI